MPELKLLFLQMAVILGAARLAAAAFRFAGQPEVIGEIAAGILLGPSLLEYMLLAPGRFWKQLAKLSPAREPRRDIVTSSSPETR